MQGPQINTLIDNNHWTNVIHENCIMMAEECNQKAWMCSRNCDFIQSRSDRLGTFIFPLMLISGSNGLISFVIQLYLSNGQNGCTTPYSKNEQLILNIISGICFIFMVSAAILVKVQSTFYSLDSFKKLKDAQGAYKNIRSQIQSQLQLDFSQREPAPNFYNSIIRQFDSIYDDFDDQIIKEFKLKYPNLPAPDGLAPNPHYNNNVTTTTTASVVEQQQTTLQVVQPSTVKSNNVLPAFIKKSFSSHKSNNNNNNNNNTDVSISRHFPGEYSYPAVFGGLRQEFEQKRFDENTSLINELPLLPPQPTTRTTHPTTVMDDHALNIV